MIYYTQQEIKERFRESNLYGKERKPFIRPNDFASSGTTTQYFSKTVGREHFCLSKLETNTLILCDFDERVKDIREQFALDPNLTRQIASSLGENGYKHPKIPGTNINHIMTTDLVLTLYDGRIIALSIKYRSALTVNKKKKNERRVKRTKEKIEIEAQYWSLLGAEFYVITEEVIDETEAQNKFLLLNLKDPTENELDNLKDYLCGLRESVFSIDDYSKDFEEFGGYPTGYGNYLFKLMIKYGFYWCDLRKKLNFEEIYYDRKCDNTL